MGNVQLVLALGLIVCFLVSKLCWTIIFYFFICFINRNDGGWSTEGNLILGNVTRAAFHGVLWAVFHCSAFPGYILSNGTSVCPFIIGNISELPEFLFLLQFCDSHCPNLDFTDDSKAVLHCTRKAVIFKRKFLPSILLSVQGPELRVVCCSIGHVMSCLGTFNYELT